MSTPNGSRLQRRKGVNEPLKIGGPTHEIKANLAFSEEKEKTNKRGEANITIGGGKCSLGLRRSFLMVENEKFGEERTLHEDNKSLSIWRRRMNLC